jgi:hypothetical protein
MVILELCEIIDVAVDNDPQGIRLVFRRDVALGKDLGHGVGAANRRGSPGFRWRNTEAREE